MEQIIRIENEPEYAKKYEFEVARKDRGMWWFWGAYKDGFRAEQIACELRNLGNEVAIFHNARIQGIKRD